ncbi:MAG: gfo/Idh/MocA family oxidoreductase, partial [Bryobacteraceae bacterium]
AIYKSGVRMVISSRARSGVTFEGTEGSIWVDRGYLESKPDPTLIYSDIADNEIHLYKSENHYENFIDCVLSRKEPIAPVEHGHRSITIAHIGNIALRLGRNLKWDPVAERILNDDEANRMLSRPMRAPWSLPEI